MCHENSNTLAHFIDSSIHIHLQCMIRDIKQFNLIHTSTHILSEHFEYTFLLIGKQLTRDFKQACCCLCLFSNEQTNHSLYTKYTIIDIK